MTDARPRPRAFRLDEVAVDDKPATAAPKAHVMTQTAPIPVETTRLGEDEVNIETAQRSGVARRWRPSLGSLVLSGLGGLVSMAASLWVYQLIEALWAKAEGLGWIGIAFAALLLLGLLGLGLREAVAVWRQARIAELHAKLADAHARDARDLARASVDRLIRLYEAEPKTARARTQLKQAMGDIVDGRDLVELAERLLMKPLDARARAEVAMAAKRVSLVTALSPRAVLDVLFVAAQIIRLTRRVAEIYGGRPGLFGFLKLARSVATHLALTGGMAVGDTVLSGLVGHGIAAKISSRMGEGVLNGMLTARVGLSALAVCRPVPYLIAKAPALGDVAPFLTRGSET